MSGGQDFWARRRAGAAAEARDEKSAADKKALQLEQSALENMAEAEMLEALDLPDPDTLTQGDDFSVFMAKTVPDQIRRRALRTLWRSNPVLANVDMLVDYGEDFTDSAMAVENIQTAYQVGKGMLKHIQEIARQEEENDNFTVIKEVIAEVDEEKDAVELDLINPEVDTKPITTQHDEAVELTDYATPSPRRMKFIVEDTA